LSERFVQNTGYRRVNWGAGLRALGCAWLLLSAGIWYGNTPALAASASLTGFALFVPLRLGSVIISRPFARLLGWGALHVGAFGCAVLVVAQLVNSPLALTAVLGNVLFLALLGLLAVAIFRAGRSGALRTWPAAASAYGNALAQVRTWAAALGALR
jgi:hypothetical protein